MARLRRDLERLLIAEGEVIESRHEPGWCRNMLVIRMPDGKKLMTAVQGGQHHLVVAGGHHLSEMGELTTAVGMTLFPV